MPLGHTGWFLVCKVSGIGHLYKVLSSIGEEGEKVLFVPACSPNGQGFLQVGQSLGALAVSPTQRIR